MDNLRVDFFFIFFFNNIEMNDDPFFLDNIHDV